MSYGVGLRNGVAFALGTIPSLTSGGGLRPSLMLDFLSGSLDSRITFSRGTQAMQYGSDGTLQYAPNNLLTYSNQADDAAWTKSNSFVQTNLLTYSEQFDNAAWTKANATVTANSTIAPDGTLTADTLIDDGTNGRHSLNRSQTLVASAPYTLSLYVKAGTGRYVTLSVSRVAAGSTYYAARYDLQTSTVTATAASGSTTHVASSIVNVGSDWYRCDLTGILSTFTDAVVMVSGAINPTGFGDRGAEIYVGSEFTWLLWGAQFVQGSVPGDYRATTSAALPVLYADYNGALRARKLCEDAAASVAHRVLQAQTTSTISSLSVVAKAAERTWVYVRFTDSASVSKYAWFNLATGALGTVGSGMTGNIQSAGNGYYRCTLSGPALVGSNNCIIGATTADGLDSYTGNGSSGIYIADAQLTPGYLPLAVTETTSAAVYGPRFDYDPVTKVARGLLIEEQRVNLLLQSNDFQASWLLTNITRTLANTTSPEGVLNGVKIEATATAGAFATQLRQSAVVAATSATGSVYVKQGTSATKANEFLIRNSTTATDLIAGTLNYSTGVFTYTTGSTGVVVTNVGNGWWRISVTATAGITAGDAILWYVGWVGAAATAGDFLYAYGAQLEAGAFATSYIPTVGSTATRNADSASITTLTPWFNAAAGTLYTESSVNGLNPAAGNAAAAFNDTTTTNFIVNRLLTTGVTPEFQVRTGGVVQATLIGGAVSATAVLKMAGAYAANDFAASMNGGTVLTDASGTIPTVTRLVIGATEFTSLANILNGWVRSVRYYPTRLPNASLRSITA